MHKTWFNPYRGWRPRRQAISILFAFDDRIALILRRAAQDTSGGEL